MGDRTVWRPPVTQGGDGEAGLGTQSLSGYFQTGPYNIMYYFIKRSQDCAAKPHCDCNLRKREKAVIFVAGLHCLFLAVNLYFFIDFICKDDWNYSYNF